MPYIINGCGTWYYGRSDRVVRPGVCQFCRKPGNLESYNTILFFVLVLVPIIPLARKRIIDKCGRCRRHLAAPLKKYQAARKTDIETAVKDYCADPSDAKKAGVAIGMAVSYRAPDSFRAVAGLVGENLPEDAAIQGLIGSAHQFFGHTAEAEESFKRSLALAASTEVSEEYARLLLGTQRPEEAQAELAHIFGAPRPELAGWLWAVVEGYQGVGRHQEALAVLEAWRERVPEVQHDPKFGRYRARSEKNLGSGKRLKPLKAPMSKGMWVLIALVVVAIMVVIVGAVMT